MGQDIIKKIEDQIGTSVMYYIEAEIGSKYNVIKDMESKGLKFDRIYLHPDMFMALSLEIDKKYHFGSTMEILIQGQSHQINTFACGGFEFKLCRDYYIDIGEIVLGFKWQT